MSLKEFLLFINSTLNHLKFKNRVWKNLGNINYNNVRKRKKYLEKIADYVN